MSRPPDPHEHPRPSNGGDEIRAVHVHDVLNGRGVNIAQHPGNERFRALVNTRYDESYCSTFSTSEKRALAKEIIDHINSLDPPGRFLKRNGKSHSSRGLTGPWEELTPKEVLKKTCQALRDCNRTDRTGYAAAVSAPQDVVQNAQERSRLGLTLKQHAAAAVARSNALPASYDDSAFHTSMKKKRAARSSPNNLDRRQVAADRGPVERPDVGFRSLSPHSMNADWLKRPDNVESVPRHGLDRSPSPHGAAIGSYMGAPVRQLQPPSAMLSTYHATPTGPPHMTSIPVTNTPMQPPMYRHHTYSGQHRTVPGPLRQPPPIPPPHSPGIYYHQGHSQHSGQHRNNGEEDSHARIVSLPAPYSPVVWNRHNANEEVDDSAEPVPMAAWKTCNEDQDRQDEEDLQSAAAAAALMNNDAGRNDFDLLSGEDLPNDDGSLCIDDLE